MDKAQYKIQIYFVIYKREKLTYIVINVYHTKIEGILKTLEKNNFWMKKKMNKMQCLHNWISNIWELSISDIEYKLNASSWIEKQIVNWMAINRVERNCVGNIITLTCLM